jgi:hypothetical protein
VRLLARDHFNPAPALNSRSVDKLFLLSTNAPAPAYIAKAVPPVTSVRSTVLADPEAASALQRFLAEHAVHSIGKMF